MAKGIVEKVKSYRPLEDRIVVRRLDRGDKSEGGRIHIPESAQEDRRLAEVVSIGPGVWRNGAFIEVTLKPGDKVLTVLHKGVDLQCGDEMLQVLRETDVMLVVEI
jgi:chaperonin GroES